jgi:vacuolar-type H+-ATPase subunit I/STV1
MLKSTTRMDEKTRPTVEMSLEALSVAVGKASEDLRSVRAALDVARADIATRNTSMSREVVKDAERVIDHLRQADEGLREVLKDLAERD